jgi:hypothetical protein
MLRKPLYALAGAALIVLSAAAPASRAATVTYEIDSFDLNSALGFANGTINGGSASQQAGSVSPIAVSGTIVADRVGNTIQFLSGGVAIVANQNGNFAPGFEGDALETDPANFGLQGGGALVAVRDLRFHPLSSGPITINGSNQFAGSAYDIVFDDGGIDYAVGLTPIFGRHDLTSFQFGSVPNGSPGNASVAQGANGETITLPVRITIPFSVSQGGDSTITLNGTLIATAVPEPATAALLLAPLAGLTLRRRRRA